RWSPYHSKERTEGAHVDLGKLRYEVDVCLPPERVGNCVTTVVTPRRAQWVSFHSIGIPRARITPRANRPSRNQPSRSEIEQVRTVRGTRFDDIGCRM